MAFALGPRARAAGYRLVAFDSIGSTNAEALTRARAGDAGPLWLVSPEQTAGRGRRSRTWMSQRGNLAASIVEAMEVAPAAAATLGFAAGLALEAALRQVSIEAGLRSPAADTTFLLKWPNDLLAGQHKLAGILLEAEAIGSGQLAVVAGIGVNVVAAPQGTPYPATSLAALGADVSAEDVFGALSDAWTHYRGIWNNGKGFADIRSLWLACAAGIGKTVSIQSGGVVIEGTFDTIDESGCMIVVTASGRRVAITAGDVHFGDASSSHAAAPGVT